MESNLTLVDVYKQKSEEALAKIGNLTSFRESDSMVDFIFKTSRELFDRDLDAVDVGYLLKVGGKLASAYAYIGNKTAHARAQRDIYQQKMEEVINELSVKNYQDNQKITLARSQAKIMSAELMGFVIGKEYEKNSWENLLNACDKLVSFVQSAIKVKEGERYRSSNMQDNN